jgi:hypothetical protein
LQFNNLFERKPEEFNKFWEEQKNDHAVCSLLRVSFSLAPWLTLSSFTLSLQAVIASLRGGKGFDKARLVSRLCRSVPRSWPDCVAWARLKFEKYFNHKVKTVGQRTGVVFLAVLMLMAMILGGGEYRRSGCYVRSRWTPFSR